MVEISISLPHWFLWVLTFFCLVGAALSGVQAWLKYREYVLTLRPPRD